MLQCSSECCCIFVLVRILVVERKQKEKLKINRWFLFCLNHDGIYVGSVSLYLWHNMENQYEKGTSEMHQIIYRIKFYPLIQKKISRRHHQIMFNSVLFFKGSQIRIYKSTITVQSSKWVLPPLFVALFCSPMWEPLMFHSGYLLLFFNAILQTFEEPPLVSFFL